MTITVASVLRSGGDFTQDHVWELKTSVRRHLAMDHRFRVLTDRPFAPWSLPLAEPWPGWWAKIDLFRPGLFSGPVLYLDLDTLIIGDLTDLARYYGRFAMLADFTLPERLQSGIMAWTPGAHTAYLWSCFAQDPERHMRTYRGDGQFLNAFAQDPVPEVLQVLYPGQIISYKNDIRQQGTMREQPDREVPREARVICFHGKPRPWNTKLWGRR